MIIVMQPLCTEDNIEHILAFLEDHQLTGHLSRGVEHTVIGVLGAPGPSGSPTGIGGINSTTAEALEGLPGVERVLRVSKPYKLVSREFHPENTVIRVPLPSGAGDPLLIGSEQVVMMAGPCTVESEQQLMVAAEAVRRAGVTCLRGGAFKPSTSPYSFRGMGEAGLKLLARARAAFGMAIITEVMTPTDVPLVCQYADILQIGARNMQNYMLLDAVGRQPKPVMLKRGMSATIEEWLLAAEYIVSQGNKQVMLCERGIRTFETMTRNTLDVSALPLIKHLSHLPVIGDPSHGTGRRDLVGALALAVVAAGADGLLIEVHPDPGKALKDGAQSLTIEQFQELMPRLQSVARAVSRDLASAPLSALV
ncbi:MAG TPA: 3-deoxy-7-phosphoheptulonate synthase [Ktedonobacteraceae bacterium]